MTFRISVSMRELYQKSNRLPLEEKIAQLGLSGMVIYTGDKLRVEDSVVKQFFETPIHSMIEHVQQILAKPNMQNVETILVVGGFGECKLVQNLIQKEIKNKRIIIPEEAGLVILKGAVRFGHFQDIVRSRIMAHTYGLAVVEEFDEQRHTHAKVKFIGDERYADDVFEIIIRAGEVVNIGEIISKGPFTPVSRKRTSFRIYNTEKYDPKYITDEGFTHMGTLMIDHANGRTESENELQASLIFGDTELLMKAVNIRTKEEFSTYIDCL